MREGDCGILVSALLIVLMFQLLLYNISNLFSLSFSPCLSNFICLSGSLRCNISRA